MNRKYAGIVVCTALLVLSGCGDGNSTYTVGGTVTGLNGDSFTIRSGTTELTLRSGARRFAFPRQANHTPFDITIVTQPRFPIQICNVSNGSGTVNGANVTNVSIACVAGYVVLGAIQGLTGSGLVIRNNASDLTIPAGAPAFTFPPQLDGDTYNVTVVTQPSNPAQTCTVTNGSGVLHGGHEAGVVITCDPAIARAPTTQSPFDAATTGGTMGRITRIVADSHENAAWNPGATKNLEFTFDVDGNALSVWEQSDGTCSNIYANNYAPGAGWGAPLLIATDTCKAFEPHVAVNPGGDGIAVWYQSSASGGVHIWANRYVMGIGWGTAERIEAGAGDAKFLQVSIDRDGNALAAWERSDGNRRRIYANRYTADSGWGTAVPIESDAGDAAQRAGREGVH
jgi:hypothetical protein